MRDKGYVETVPNPDDKRQSLVNMTAAGAQAYANAAPIMQMRRDGLSESFDQDEIATFLRLIDRYEAHLNQPNLESE